MASSSAPSALTAYPVGRLAGRTSVPGDKSISHRALMFGALAVGETRIEGLLEGEDVLRTAAALKLMGVPVERLGPGKWRVYGVGVGGLAEPDDILDMGNAGTGTRLMMGIVAGHGFTSFFTGDASLRSRPMGRVAAPLQQMGARILSRDGGRPPLVVTGVSAPLAIEYVLPMASAQVKSAVLLAGLNTAGGAQVIEPEPTRDHTERMLRGFGAEVVVEDRDDGRWISLAGGQSLTGTKIRVPGDPSSAAFPIVAALITPGSEVTVEGVLLNELRTGLFTTLKEMGADLTLSNVRIESGEEVGDLTARHSQLKGVEVPPERAPSMIDEYPILAVAAAFATGATYMRGIGEMRVKESDRIALMAAGLAASGVGVEEEPEALTVVGTGAGNHPVKGGARVVTKGDHRIAMSHLVMGLASDAPMSVDEPGMIATSFPGFVELMTGLGAQLGAVA